VLRTPRNDEWRAQGLTQRLHDRWAALLSFKPVAALARISAENPFTGHRFEIHDKYQCGSRWHGA
jgi:hypothetical protein